jgi:hypothetical protein
VNPTAASQRTVIASVLLVAAVPVATWWLVGDLSEPLADPDYMIHPIGIAGPLERGLGFGATVSVLVAAPVLVRALWRGELNRKWLPPIVFLIIAGAIAGAGWRVVTAGVIGANIGGAIVTGVGLPLVIVLVVAAMASSFLRPVRRGGPPR